MKTQEKNIKEREESLKEGSWTDLTLSVEEVAAELAVTEETVRRWCRAGALGHFKIGNTLRIKGSDLKEYLEGRYRPRRIWM